MSHHALVQLVAAIAAFLVGLHVVTAGAEGELSELERSTAQVEVAVSTVDNTSQTVTSTVRTLPADAAVSSEAASVSSTTQTIQPESAAIEPETAPVMDRDVHCQPSASAAYCIYEVQVGDTLAGIAMQLGLEGSGRFDAAALIAMSNGLVPSDSGLIHPGQELRVPSQQGVIHTVQPSQSLSFLAEQYGVSTSAIVSANAIANPDRVTEGRVLLIPSPTNRPSATSDETAAAQVESGAQGESSDQPEPAAGASQTSRDATEPGEETAETVGSTRVAQSDAEHDVAAESSQDGEPSAEATAALGEAETSDEGLNEGEADDRDAEVESEDERDAGVSPTTLDEQAIRERFAAGYRAVGGPEQFLQILLDVTIPCESSYNLAAYNPVGPFFGLLQFLPSTWNRSGGGDWKDPWQQGANAGRLVKGASPATQWPYCWPA